MKPEAPGFRPRWRRRYGYPAGRQLLTSEPVGDDRTLSAWGTSQGAPHARSLRGLETSRLPTNVGVQ